MYIPRQSHGSDGARGVRVDAAAGLRARRRDLVGELRTATYWQRLVQARRDLCVAGLLYAVHVPHVPPVRHPGTDEVDLAGLATPPDGLDLARVVGGHGACDSPGAHLERLREAAVALGHRSRALQEELDVVTLALHTHLADDGAEVLAGAAASVPRTAPDEVAGVGTGAAGLHPA